MKQFFVLLCLLVILLNPTIVFGQKTFISVGPELALPEYCEHSYNNRGTGYGGSLQLESFFSKHFSGTVTIGYISFGKTSPSVFYPTYTHKIEAIPIQTGVKYYIRKKHEKPKGFYLSAELGGMPTVTHIVYTDGSKQNVKEGGISCAPGAGYRIKNFELAFRLQYNLSEIGFQVYYYNFRVAYAFHIGKTKN